VYCGRHTWNVDHEAPLIKTCHLVSQLAVSRDDNTDIVRASLNINASEGLRQASLNA
jgi:hypothetical protein